MRRRLASHVLRKSVLTVPNIDQLTVLYKAIPFPLLTVLGGDASISPLDDLFASIRCDLSLHTTPMRVTSAVCELFPVIYPDLREAYVLSMFNMQNTRTCSLWCSGRKMHTTTYESDV